MPLPKRTPPTANPNGATQDTKAPGKSRLPALPPGGLKPKKSYQYLVIPATMERCFYLVKALDCKQFTSEKDNTEKFCANFEVLATDVEGVKVGSSASKMLDLQGKAAVYFWSNFADICLALCGVEATAEALAEFEADRETTYGEVCDEQSLAGMICWCKFRRGTNKDGKSTYYCDWEVASEADIAKYTKPAAG